MIEIGNRYIGNFFNGEYEVVSINGQDVGVQQGNKSDVWQLGDMQTWIAKGIKQDANDENEIERGLQLIN